MSVTFALFIKQTITKQLYTIFSYIIPYNALSLMRRKTFIHQCCPTQRKSKRNGWKNEMVFYFYIYFAFSNNHFPKYSFIFYFHPFISTVPRDILSSFATSLSQNNDDVVAEYLLMCLAQSQYYHTHSHIPSSIASVIHPAINSLVHSSTLSNTKPSNLSIIKPPIQSPNHSIT